MFYYRIFDEIFYKTANLIMNNYGKTQIIRQRLITIRLTVRYFQDFPLLAILSH